MKRVKSVVDKAVEAVSAVVKPRLTITYEALDMTQPCRKKPVRSKPKSADMGRSAAL